MAKLDLSMAFDMVNTNLIIKDRSTVAHWYVICFSPGGPGFKSRQGMIFQNKNERRNV